MFTFIDEDELDKVEFVEDKGTCSKGTTALDIVDSEISKYTEEDLLDSDPMEWWRTHMPHYPTMPKL